MSNEERVSWVALIVNVIIGTLYFSAILRAPADADLFGAGTAVFAAGLVMLAIVVGIGTQVVLQVVQSTSGGGKDAAKRDERDALIELKATRNAHFLLGFLVICVLVQIALIEWAQRYWRRPAAEVDTVLELLATGPLQPMHVAQLLLAALTLGAIMLNASRVFYYRRGY